MFLSLCWASVERKRNVKTTDELLANRSWTFFVVSLCARPSRHTGAMHDLVFSHFITLLTFSMLGMHVCVLEHKYHSYCWCLRVCTAGDFPVGFGGLGDFGEKRERNVTRRVLGHVFFISRPNRSGDVTSANFVKQRTVQLDMHVCATLHKVLAQQLESTRFARHMII